MSLLNLLISTIHVTPRTVLFKISININQQNKNTLYLYIKIFGSVNSLSSSTFHIYNEYDQIVLGCPHPLDRSINYNCDVITQPTTYSIVADIVVPCVQIFLNSVFSGYSHINFASPVNSVVNFQPVKCQLINFFCFSRHEFG